MAQKIKVRIALAVDKTGDWNASGWKAGSDEDKMDSAVGGVKLGENRYWIETEVELPEAKVVSVDAEKAL